MIINIQQIKIARYKEESHSILIVNSDSRFQIAERTIVHDLLKDFSHFEGKQFSFGILQVCELSIFLMIVHIISSSSATVGEKEWKTNENDHDSDDRPVKSICLVFSFINVIKSR